MIFIFAIIVPFCGSFLKTLAIESKKFWVKKQKRNLNVEKQYYEKNNFYDYLEFIRFSNDYGAKNGNEGSKCGGCFFD